MMSDPSGDDSKGIPSFNPAAAGLNESSGDLDQYNDTHIQQYPSVSEMAEFKIEPYKNQKWLALAYLNPKWNEEKGEKPVSKGEAVQFLGAFETHKKAAKFATKIHKKHLYWTDVFIVPMDAGWMTWPPPREGENVDMRVTQEKLRGLFRQHEINNLDQAGKMKQRIKENHEKAAEEREAARARIAEQNRLDAIAEAEAKQKEQQSAAENNDDDDPLQGRMEITVVDENEDEDKEPPPQEQEDDDSKNDDAASANSDDARAKLREKLSQFKNERRQQSARATGTTYAAAASQSDEQGTGHGQLHNGERVVSTAEAPCVITMGAARLTPPEDGNAMVNVKSTRQ